MARDGTGLVVMRTPERLTEFGNRCQLTKRSTPIGLVSCLGVL